ncbi:YolD-like family protein [Eubacteriaceae bacterium Marseille-Q4139]|nr:YolD-like family protein [Eubacteriaceae bacterium Marseille-Q4139]
MPGRPQMTREERAKQFMPFAALKGYPAALRKKEKIVVPKAELSEEQAGLLDRKLRCVEKNDMVSVIYFCREEYLKVTGMVSRMDQTARILKVVNTRIPFDDIYDIAVEKAGAEPRESSGG